MKKTNIVSVRAYGFFSDAGSQRPINEDACIAVPEHTLFGVADGYGGNGVGDVAAKFVLDRVSYFVKNGLGDSEVTLPFVYRRYLTEPGNLVFNAFLYANSELIKKNSLSHINGRGGASVLFAFMADNKMVFANSGLCQAMLVRRGRVQPLVRPRSYNALRGTFQGSWNGRWAFPIAALGHSADLEPEIFELQVEKGDVVILSTDGVYPRLNEDDYLDAARSLKSSKSLDSAISEQNHRLVELAIQKGSNDNMALTTILCG